MSSLATNSLVHGLGEIFQPIYKLFANILAAIYAVIPNYAIAIIVFTIIIMGALTPLTVKSTKSMMAMQRLQPEIKRLQQKYKGSGAEGRQQMNEELMRLYKEEGVNPASGCVPMLIQMPFLFIMYSVIKGLTHTVTVHGHVVANPLYIPHGSKMYHNLVAHPGEMNAFGMNLALKPFSHHGSVAAAIPYFVLVAAAVVLQYIQMNQMNKRNPAAAQANPQVQTMQKVMPILFAYIYFVVPAGVVLYMLTSTTIRIITQDVIFRRGIVQAPGERTVPGAKGAPAPKDAPRSGGSSKGGTGKGTPAANGSGGGSSTGRNGTRRTGPEDGAVDVPSTEVTGAKSPSKPAPSGGQSGNGKSAAGGGSSTGAGAAPKAHPRSKAKRARKAR
jgi:YidC/Oxa1 family membrane protein insertase